MRNLERFRQSSILSKNPSALLPPKPSILIIMRKKCGNLNFGPACVTIRSAQIGHVTCSFSQTEQLYFEMNHTEELSTVGNQLKKYMRSLIIDDILSEGGNVSTEYYPGSFRAIGSKYKVSSVTSFKPMEDVLSNGSGKSPSASISTMGCII